MGRLVMLFTFLFSFSCFAEVDGTAPSDEALAVENKERKYVLSELTLSQLIEGMVWVEGGSFEMGSDSDEAYKREGPVHTVTLDGFYIGKTEVTQSVFEELMGWNNSYFACQDCPVNNLSWLNMQLFITRLNAFTGKKFRLPTEAEWAYAARGGLHSMGYAYSGSNDIGEVAWFAQNSQRRSHPVAQKKPNELGLFDMTGNLWEFVQDDMNPRMFLGGNRHNPVFLRPGGDKKTSMKVIRGGGYEFSAKESLVYRRDGSTSNVRMPDIGFRLAMSKD